MYKIKKSNFIFNYKFCLFLNVFFIEIILKSYLNVKNKKFTIANSVITEEKILFFFG
jgi:hypothetical protein